jgi:hypothetical protein
MIRRMNGRGLKRMTLVIAVCALVGAVAGIAGSAAAPSKSSSKSNANSGITRAEKLALKRQFHAFRGHFERKIRPGFFAFGFGGPGFPGGPVHDEAVIPKRDGSGFLTITSDRGTLNSVDGTTVHLKEGTDKAVYKDDVGIDVGSSARVIRNGKKAALSDLKQGDHVVVITGTPKGNIVIAADATFLQQRMKDHEGWRHFGGPGGPPPPGAPAPGDNGGSNQNGSDSGQSSGGSNS